MAIPHTTREKIVRAFNQFDQYDRYTNKWTGWEQKKNHKFAISYEGQLYPVKAIIRYATDGFGSFGGGNEANKYIRERGFTIVALHETEEEEAELVEDEWTLEDNELEDKFQEFLANPMNQLILAVRHYRAAELRELLSDLMEIDLATFNREVWNLGYILLSGEKINFNKIEEQSQSTINAIHNLVGSNKLEYVGNSIWGTASRIFGSSLPTATEEEKTDYIRSALEILNDTELEPIDKVKAMCKIKGFGFNIATGLAMVYHPNDFALFNSESKQAISSLGYQFANLDEFMSCIAEVKDMVKAENYIELDAFLYYLNRQTPVPKPESKKGYVEPHWADIFARIQSKGMKVSERMLQRYHLSLKTRGFVVLSGISGTGKTWLTENYANAVEAQYLLVPVAPNWMTNEDLLGYYNPVEGAYKHTEVSEFIAEAEKAYIESIASGVKPEPFHLVLDEMNLARVEYYFSKFLSLMETRARGELAYLELAPDHSMLLPPNLVVIGTVNIDETTHGFADKVYDRAQLIEMTVEAADIYEHIGNVPYRAILMDLWRKLCYIAPFSYRVIDEIKSYVSLSSGVGLTWEEALDDQIVQKILPKIKGTSQETGVVLEELLDIVAVERFPISHEKITKMNKGYKAYGITSYF
ncbi:McrB family protein [Pseudoneobacillus sp. C159]